MELVGGLGNINVTVTFISVAFWKKEGREERRKEGRKERKKERRIERKKERRIEEKERREAKERKAKSSPPTYFHPYKALSQVKLDWIRNTPNALANA